MARRTYRSNFRGARAANKAPRQATPVRATSPEPTRQRQKAPVPTRISSISIEERAQELADEIIAQREAEARTSRLGKIYTRFDVVDDVLANNVETVTRGLFAGNVASLTSMFTSSNLTDIQKTYYQEIYSTGDPASNSSANVELSLAYGHFNGSGSKDAAGSLNNDTPSRAIYKQYAQVLLGPDDKKFTINGSDTDSIYVLNFNRARMREKVDPGNFEITLAQLSGSLGPSVPNAAHTGSHVKIAGKDLYIQLIDDSSLTSATLGESGQVYNIVSGSLDGAGMYLNSGDTVNYGLLYPQHGVAILDARQLDKVHASGGVNFHTVTGSQIQGENAVKLFTSISSSAGVVGGSITGGIQARSAEAVKSTYYFVRAKNAEFNYSNNPSFVTGSLGQLSFNSFKNDPQTFITSVGLYNDRRELLAIAKLSQPLLKNYTREALIKVKLDF
tara:strand:+ start:28529 stop:29866 length:1338 start_codon:yes stop_codon:yes gene_type:complete